MELLQSCTKPSIYDHQVHWISLDFLELGVPMIFRLTTHLLSIVRADWPKLRDMFKARDAKTWQHKFPVGLPLEFVHRIHY